MKLKYLGTAAAEGFPAVFCNCEHCRQARRLGGKNIRTRSQAIINDDLLIDLPADTYAHFLAGGIEGDAIPYLLITHSHSDHFYKQELAMRYDAFAHDMRAPRLQLYCGTGTAEIIDAIKEKDQYTIDFTTLHPFDSVPVGEYRVTALPARHFQGDGALFYIIEKDKTVLYAHDTGYFFEEVFTFLEQNKYVFDLISLDCTNVDIPVKDHGTHMGFENIHRLVARLREMGAVNDNTKIVVNHFSHNGAPLQHLLEQKAAPHGYLVAYDGMEIEI